MIAATLPWPAALAAARRALGMSRRKFAKIAHVSRQAASEWEKSGALPKAPAFARILQALRRQGCFHEFENLIAAASRARENA